MNKVICTAGVGPAKELLDISLPSMRDYAERHGYDLNVTLENNCGRPASWLRIPIIAELLRSYDVAVWIDADAVVVDPTRDIASELRPGFDFYIVEQYWDNIHTTIVNAAVLMFRASDWAQDFLSAIWAQEDLIENDWWENSAIFRLLGYPKIWINGEECEVDVVGDNITSNIIGGSTREHWLSRTHLLPSSDWNSNPPWMVGDSPVINHYPGRPYPMRAEAMRADISRINAGVVESKRSLEG